MLYTVGIWTVTAGREDAFVAAWQTMAEWPIGQFPGAHGRFRDREQPQRFISFGPWHDETTIAAWRGSPEFGQHLDRLRECPDDFTPCTFDIVADVQAH